MIIGETISHYRVVELLGAGGMGEVFKAEDTRLKRAVALKFLPLGLTQDPDAKQRLLHEAQAASALDHPNICTIYEIEETSEGRLFVAMAYYEGRTLRDRLAGDPLTVDEALTIGAHVARGVAAAHEAGIVHRDIRPANIMLTPRGAITIPAPASSGQSTASATPFASSWKGRRLPPACATGSYSTAAAWPSVRARTSSDAMRARTCRSICTASPARTRASLSETTAPGSKIAAVKTERG